VVIAILSLAFFPQGMAALGWTLVSDLAPEGMLGITSGIFSLAANLAGIVTPIDAPLRGDRHGVPGVEIDEVEAVKYPYKPASLPIARLEDGTMATGSHGRGSRDALIVALRLIRDALVYLAEDGTSWIHSCLHPHTLAKAEKGGLRRAGLDHLNGATLGNAAGSHLGVHTGRDGS
jgi:hypothetical protein